MINFDTDYWHQNYTRQFWRAVIIGFIWCLIMNSLGLIMSLHPNMRPGLMWIMPFVSLFGWFATSWGDYHCSDIRMSVYRLKNNLCVDCGYDVKSIMDTEKQCSECGRPIAKSYWNLPFAYEPL